MNQNKFTQITLNWLLLLTTLTVNALANILPINGLNTGQVSNLYPNLFVPAGFTFSIWSIIYILLITYVIAFPFYRFRSNTPPAIVHYLIAINPLFQLTCIINTLWVLAWHHLQMTICMALMLLFLFTLIRIFKKVAAFEHLLSSKAKLLLITPFVVYLAWISVATIAQITAALVKWNFQPGLLNEMQWSVLMVVIAILLASFITLKFRVISYAFVVAWALWGIAQKQQVQGPPLFWVPMLGVVVLPLLSFIMLFQRKSESSNQPLA